jgi:imidazole glycerol-phosphate synthase subunit HisH
VKVAVVDTGTANLASMMAALTRCGAKPEPCRDPAVVRAAERVVLPGVGAFAAGMERLRACDLVGALAERVAAGRPLLCVCLGLQLLCAASDESPGVAGIAVIADTVHRFTARAGERLIVPQLGWNLVEPAPGCRVLERGHAYYANSYRLEKIPKDWNGATTDHGGPFVAALERGAVLACQFHPELSGPWGHALLGRWLEAKC